MAKTFSIPELEGASFSFTRRPTSLPPELRPMWRVAVVALILHICCRGSRSNLQRLYVLNWAVRTPEARSEFSELLDGKLKPSDVIVRFDPGLLRAIDLATGAQLVKRIGGDKFELTERGHTFAKAVLDSGGFETEKQYFDSIRRRVPESKIQQIMNMDAT
jgi:hypothetical protein